MPTEAPSTARLLIACPDARGIVAAVARFISDHGGNLLDADQHTDREHGEFFMRVEFDLTECDLGPGNFAAAWSPLAAAHRMSWRVRFDGQPMRVAILVGTLPHCLQDLLWRYQAGELPIEIPAIISNHDALRPIAAHAGITFHHLPIVNRDKAAQEAAIRELLEREGVELVVLARYMQVLSPAMLHGWENRIINIHHSFLPAFAGGDPYRQAYERGVKLIGATSHYVTEVLDDGPIIAQDVVQVSHRCSVDDLKRMGRDLERTVLARAVRMHVHDRILVSQNKTVVFD
ncbi:formyltetrahydrofolate deformylase [Thioalkalivibrio sp. XN279]|uniref:formyltetrahydrofolate deformylase n=1 Tax=Thioalkalivibrio sp. XN279 TaxID=2714953 RepID=UPI00140D478C|nr:formyltetrahydrofolate deformylase [Thioalkalivibrio sp. XN279]NHA15345.1 formyltetrahydrofolate deformylase [Thioalkalivibrio sp. XN279]